MQNSYVHHPSSCVLQKERESRVTIVEEGGTREREESQATVEHNTTRTYNTPLSEMLHTTPHGGTRWPASATRS